MKKNIIELLEKLYPEEKSIRVEVPQEKNYGDYACNLAFVMAKKLKKNPTEVAKDIATKIIAGKPEFLEKVEAKAGFVNFHLKSDHLQQQILKIIDLKDKYGQNNSGQNQKIQVEFVSANPTGPLTIGNARGGVIGDVLASVLTNSGYRVCREYYFNDAGGQIDVLGHSVLKDDLAEYKGDYIDKLNLENQEKDYRQAGIKAAQKIILQIKKTCTDLGINFDVWFAEGKDLREKDKVIFIINWLKKKNLSYEKDGAIWFKSKQFGDDKDRVLIKKDQNPTYFAVDCAYHYNKFMERKFERVIDVWGADHHGDMKRVEGFVKALGFADKFKIILHQFVQIVKDKKPVRMSKRSGNYILVDEVLKEVGLDVLRFFMLQYSANAHLNFDLKLAKERSKKNPVFYIQYAHARINSIIAKSKIENLEFKSTNLNLKLLKNKEEINLIKKLIQYPDIVLQTSQDFQVQRLPICAIELADTFHNFYEKCQVISNNNEETKARLALVTACQIVLKNCLELMGISAPRKM